MKRWVFNEHEQKVFQSLIWDGYPFAVLIYVMELRPHMDAATHIVGDKRTVCESGIAEMLERQCKPGSHSGSTKRRDRNYIQRQLKVLEDVGLIQRLKKKKRNSPMRLYLPLADTGSFRPQEERTRSEQPGANNVLLCAPDAEFPEVAGPALVRSSVDNLAGANIENHGRSAQHQESGITINNKNKLTSSDDENFDFGAVTGEVWIAEDWEPSEQLVKDLEFQYSLPAWFIRMQGGAFRIHARENGYTNSDWPGAFRLWIRRGMAERWSDYMEAVKQYLSENKKAIGG